MKAQLIMLAAALALAAPATASAYCRATTCDPTKEVCKRDTTGSCILSGASLHWASSCITVSVQADGAESMGIDFDTARGSVERAFAAWTSVDCGGGSPAISVDVSGPVECKKSEYSSDKRNANIVWFREDSWPYVGSEDALGITRLRFDLGEAPGEIWDADIEINAVTEPLSVDPNGSEVDLDSLLTHEAGHLLGLAHTDDELATMYPGYEPGSKELRSLEADDMDGICAIYPPEREPSSTSCEPRHGFSERCAAEQPAEPTGGAGDDPALEPESSGDSGGCSLTGATTPPASAIALLALLGGVPLLRRRRRN